MSDSSKLSPPIDPELLPGPSDGGPDELAAAQFVHGLLEHLHCDDRAVQRRRVDAVMSAIDGGPRVAAPRPGHRRPVAPRAVTWRPWPVASGLAAAMLMLAVVVLAPSGQSPALAMVLTSVDASRRAGDRSYEVYPASADGRPDESMPAAQLDVRDVEHLLIRAWSPHGQRVVVGRSPGGAWAIRPDGSIDRYPPRRAWPRWIDFGQTTFLVQPVDALLAELPDRYTLRLLGPAPLPDGGPRRYERVAALRAPRQGPEPRRVDLWIDQESRLVQRMELHWPYRGSGHGRFGRPEGPRRWRGGPPESDDRGPRGRRGRGPAGRRGPGEPGGPDGQAPRAGRRSGASPALRPPPRLLDGRPDFERGRHAPPPRTIIFELLDDEPLPEDWFLPETHEHESRQGAGHLGE
jgi:hypothetical protein